jgi:hypothetical protein
MSTVLLLVPDFAIILCGFGLNRFTRWGKHFWEGLEKLIYYVLFPALLFHSIAKNRIDFALAGPALSMTCIVVLSGIFLAFAGKWLLKPDARLFASVFQAAFRFNSYIGLAIIGRLHGEPGIAAFGLIIGVAVPIANIASVWVLAHHAEKGLFAELVRNPLLLATLGGLLYNLSGFGLPEPVQMLLGRMGGASIPLGLLAVGAALRVKKAGHVAVLGSYMVGVKLLVLPLVAIFGARALGVTGNYFVAVVVLAACPVATSAYVLANRMGGDGESVALLVSVSTLLGMLTIPFWLGVMQ